MAHLYHLRLSILDIYTLINMPSLTVYVNYRYNTYIVELKRPHLKLVIDICIDVIRQHYLKPQPCDNYGIFLFGQKLPSYESIPDSGISQEVTVEMYPVRRTIWYDNEMAELHHMLDLFHVDLQRDKKFTAVAKEHKNARLQKVKNACNEWFVTRTKDWIEKKYSPEVYTGYMQTGNPEHTTNHFNSIYLGDSNTLVNTYIEKYYKQQLPSVVLDSIDKDKFIKEISSNIIKFNDYYFLTKRIE